jgi:hypothetical protein
MICNCRFRALGEFGQPSIGTTAGQVGGLPNLGRNPRFGLFGSRRTMELLNRRKYSVRIRPEI